MTKENVVKRIQNIPEQTVPVYGINTRCDRCGRLIDAYDPPDDDDDLYAQELVIMLNPDLCINSRIRMDMCRACLLPIWTQICEALGIDPDDEHRIGDVD